MAHPVRNDGGGTGGSRRCATAAGAIGAATMAGHRKRPPEPGLGRESAQATTSQPNSAEESASQDQKLPAKLRATAMS